MQNKITVVGDTEPWIIAETACGGLMTPLWNYFRILKNCMQREVFHHQHHCRDTAEPPCAAARRVRKQDSSPGTASTPFSSPLHPPAGAGSVCILLPHSQPEPATPRRQQAWPRVCVVRGKRQTLRPQHAPGPPHWAWAAGESHLRAATHFLMLQAGFRLSLTMGHGWGLTGWLLPPLSLLIHSLKGKGCSVCS